MLQVPASLGEQADSREIIKNAPGSFHVFFMWLNFGSWFYFDKKVNIRLLPYRVKIADSDEFSKKPDKELIMSG
jgi:hypothetical protein